MINFLQKQLLINFWKKNSPALLLLPFQYKLVVFCLLLSEVFNDTKLRQLPGNLAIGHIRYSTAGQSMLKNVQPFVAGYRFGSVGVAHNGNFVNYRSLRNELEESGSIFNTTSDTEVLLHLIATSNHRPFYSENC